MDSRVKRATDIISEHQGEITSQDHWGVRRLAYEIEHQDKGNYMLLKFRSERAALKELDRAFRLDDMVLRHLIVKDEEWKERNRAAQAKRRQRSDESEQASSE
jgi:small subunit ribosomal protein S6